ncbi:MAG: DeoR/GlpR family DNA-binding transcription regulator [Pseudomonadota bacterium]|uniref:DeoR/GlpR family DNA-binding transcription regulator n=1 Tax=Sphingomonas sp. ERG5 TaxID=1381597 RepID=UPI00054C0A94|nr:DeoR/GlpR family DNA-binding transcription regulator [Sphingomonas sp. ERG5]
MHAEDRDRLILELMRERGFVSFQELDRSLEASGATLRRDLDRLETSGKIVRVRGGARLVDAPDGTGASGGGNDGHLRGVPFHENVERNRAAKEAIGRAAAALCGTGETVIIDGGSTTLQMCPLLAPLELHVLTNSLHIVSALIGQPGTHISMPAGTLFREQNILLPPFDDDGMSRYRASKLFMGAASIGRHGLMQTDVLLVHAERRLLDRADEVIVLVDSSKFSAPAGHVVCTADELDIVITDDGITDRDAAMIEKAGIKLVVAPTG